MSVFTLHELHRESKKQDTKFLPVTSPNVNRFSNSFADRLSGKSATNLYLNIPPYLKYVATLHSAKQMSENWL